MSFSYPPFSGFHVIASEDMMTFGWRCESCGKEVKPSSGKSAILMLWDQYIEHLINSHALTPPKPKCGYTQFAYNDLGVVIGTIHCTLDQHIGDHTYEFILGH